MGVYLIDLKSGSDTFPQKKVHNGDSGVYFVPVPQESNVWELLLFLGCAVRKTKKESVSVLRPAV